MIIVEELLNNTLLYDVLEYSGEAIYWYDMNGKIIYVNNTTLKMLEYSKTELLTMSILDIDPNRTLDNTKELFSTLKKLKTITMESYRKKKNGIIFPVEISVNYFNYLGNEIICSYTRDITNKVNERKKLQQLISQKSILLKEIHHRVKNNLSTISSILSMQQRRTTNHEVKTNLRLSQNRIYAMALVHELLYKSDTLDSINLNEYIPLLVNDILSTMILDNKVDVAYNIDGLSCELTLALPLGIIINELITNALKYAFHTTMNPTMSISLYEHNTNLVLVVKDNGRGFERQQLERIGLGIELIEMTVTTQLEGSILWKNNKGTTCKIIIPYASGERERERERERE